MAVIVILQVVPMSSSSIIFCYRPKRSDALWPGRKQEQPTSELMSKILYVIVIA